MRLLHFVCFVLAVALHLLAAVKLVDIDSLRQQQEPNEELSLTMEWVEKARELLETAEAPEEQPESEPEQPEPEKLPPPPAQDRTEEAPPSDSATQAAAAGGGTPERLEQPEPEPVAPAPPPPPQAPEAQPPEPRIESEPTPKTVETIQPTPEPEPEPEPRPETNEPETRPEPQPPEPEPIEPPLTRVTEPEPAPQPVGPHFAPAGPGDSVSTLPLPRNVFDGPPQARLVHDFTGSFRDNLDALGGIVLLYPKSRDPRYFLELTRGSGSGTRRIGRSTTEGNALARRLSGATGIDLSTSARFGPTRIEISRSIGLGPDKLRMVAIVSDSIRARMENQKLTAMTQFGLDPQTTRAVFGQLTSDPAAPLRVTGYLDSRGNRYALRNDSE